MGRFKAKGLVVREIENIVIIFWNSHMIYVMGPYGMILFHRYFAPRGSYTQSWGNFRRKLLQYKTLNFDNIFLVAAHHFDVVEIQTSHKELDLTGKTVYLWGRYTKNNKEAKICHNYKLRKGERK